MEQISNSTEKFIQAVDRGASIVFSSQDGTWYERSIWARVLRCIMRVIFKTPDDAIELAMKFDAYLSSKIVMVHKGNICGFQKQDLPFDVSKAISSVRKALDAIRATEDESLAVIDAKQAELLKNANFSKTVNILFEKYREGICAFGALSTSARLFRTERMLTYIAKSQEEINSTPVSVEDAEWLEQKLKTWQARQFPFVDYFVDGAASDKARAKLLRLCHYPDIVKEAKNNPVLLEQFFRTVFRNMPDWSVDSIDMFVQSPFIFGRLHRSIIDKRLSEFSVKGIAFTQEGVEKGKPVKDVKLLVNGTMQSIADVSSMLKVSDKTSMTVRQLFAEFEELEYGFIEYEYLEDGGIRHFDARMPNIDPQDSDWWKKLPLVQRMTKQAIADRYGVAPKDGQALLILRASRQTPDLNVDGNHSWMDVTLPLSDGTYNVISVGKFAYRYPKGSLETLKFVFGSQPASITVVDPNRFARQRERVDAPVVPLDQEKFQKLMNLIRDDIVRANNKELVFQAQGDNCAAWIRKILFQVLPNFEVEPFEVSMMKTEVPAPLSPILSMRKFLVSDDVWNMVRIAMSWAAIGNCELSDGRGGRKTVSLVDYKPWRISILNLPAKLFDTAEKIRMATLAAIAREDAAVLPS